MDLTPLKRMALDAGNRNLALDGVQSSVVSWNLIDTSEQNHVRFQQDKFSNRISLN